MPAASFQPSQPRKPLICTRVPCKTRPKPLRHAVAATACFLKSYRLEETCSDPKCYSVLCASDKTRGAVVKHKPSERNEMPVRLRKLIGTILIIILVVVYALAAVTFASLLLGTSPWWVHLLYFFLTGLLWILPAMLIIKWMEKPAKNR